MPRIERKAFTRAELYANRWAGARGRTGYKALAPGAGAVGFWAEPYQSIVEADVVVSSEIARRNPECVQIKTKRAVAVAGYLPVDQLWRRGVRKQPKQVGFGCAVWVQ